MRGGVPLPVHRPTSPPSRALSPGTLQRQRTKTSDFDDVPEPPVCFVLFVYVFRYYSNLFCLISMLLQ